MTESRDPGEPSRVLRIGLLAGEASGDALGAGLMREMTARAAPDVRIEYCGVGGDGMRQAGLVEMASMQELAVNGFVDPIKRLPHLLRLFRRLVNEFQNAKLDAFIGIDFNVFNFLLEGALKKRGIRTVHYVSPSVYAWRRGRTRRVAKVADLLLCLYPFEPDFYDGLAVKVVYVGHPLADRIAPDAGSPSARHEARQALGLSADTVLAVLPGSRRSEVALMLGPFLDAAQRFTASHDAQVVIPCINPAIQTVVEHALAEHAGIDAVVYPGNATLGLTAADVALVKSGTSTLETMLLKRPMVVSYRLGSLSYQVARLLVRTPYVALPNILAQRMLVPEFLQDAAHGPALAEALEAQWQAARTDPQFFDVFYALHARLAQGADVSAADAVLHFTGAGKQ